MAKRKWIQKGLFITNGVETIRMGDKIKYNNPQIRYYGAWRVLGVSPNGTLLIISERPVEEITLKGMEGCHKCVEKVNKECEKYGQGDGALTARSICMQDINNLQRITEEISREHGETVGEGVYATVLNTKDSSKYWLATPYHDKKSDEPMAGIYFVDRGKVSAYNIMNIYGQIRRAIPGNIKVVVELEG